MDAEEDKFSKMYGFVARIKDLKHAEKQVLSHVFGWPEGCWESNSNLAKRLDLHPRTVQKAVRVLREKKYIEYKRIKTGRILSISVKKAVELEIPLWGETLVKNLADKMKAPTASGHRGVGHKA